MRKLFSLSFRHKVFLALLILMSVPLILTGYMAKNLTQNTVLREKENKLLAFARILDVRLGPGGFVALLRQAGVENAPREKRLQALNRALSEITDEVGASSPGLGVGYYSRALDAIVTYGPAASFGDAVGRSIPPEHPGHVVMRTGLPLAKFGSMVRGDILNAMLPIIRGGEVIGYIWANELTTDVVAQLDQTARNIFFIILLCAALTACLLFLLSKRTVRDVDRIIAGVRSMRDDLGKRIEGTEGELGEVAKNINAMAEDIAKAGEESRRAIAVLQTVLGNVDATVYVCDPHTKTLVYANEYLRNLLGGRDLQGKRCYEALQGRSEPCPFCPQKSFFDEQGNPLFSTVRWETHNQLINRDFLVTDRLITWHDGRLLHMEVGTDITERKALAVAEAANQSRREFLARMSHELRTPMNGVLGMVHLAMQADPPASQLEYLKKIQSSAALLLGIINDILDFSRIEAGKLTVENHVFSPREMVDNIRELILPRTREQNLELRIEVDASVPEYCLGDGLRLSQVLLNLLGNAAKFTIEGFVSLVMKAESVASGALRLHCLVGDSGIGMNREQQEALFKPFSQADVSTSRRFGGTGLGLSISKALVELMHGEIFVYSQEGHGSEFSFYVELAPADGPAAHGGQEDQPWETARWDGHRFLLVEDNAINQEIALAVLEDLGAAADVADNGEEGVQAFLRHDYSLIFMDVRMPIMDGLEATRRIRASSKHDAATVPIVAMTANAMREDREAGKEAGMNGHVAKPIDVSELKRVLYEQLPPGAA